MRGVVREGILEAEASKVKPEGYTVIVWMRKQREAGLAEGRTRMRIGICQQPGQITAALGPPILEMYTGP